MALEDGCEAGTVSIHSETPSEADRGELQNLRGKYNRLTEGKEERTQHRDQYRPALCMLRAGLGAEAQASEISPQEEDWG